MWPRLKIDLNKIQANARIITDLIKRQGGQIAGVVKVVGGAPPVAQAMLAGGVQALADSRLANIIKMREAGICKPITLLRSPALSEIAAVVAYTDISLNSERVVLDALGKEATKQGKVHQVIIMTDLGDGREGVDPGQLVDLVNYACTVDNIKVIGLGTNFTCFSGEPPTFKQLEELVRLKQELNQPDLLISAGTSSVLHLMAIGQWQAPWLKQLNHWRIGESIFTGCDIITGEPFGKCWQNVCTLQAEIIEIQEKSPMGGSPTKRGIVALGTQEIGAGNLSPLADDLKILGASSDHLVVELAGNYQVGELVTFSLDYQALLAAATSPYVEMTFNSSSL